MKHWKMFVVSGLVTGSALLFAFSLREETHPTKVLRPYPKGCVFRTLMGEESADSMFIYKSPERVLTSVDRGLTWMMQAQNKNGGWGAGSHAQQNVLDPHAVKTDPATTAMVAMAILRSGSTLSQGTHSAALKKALDYLLTSIENSSSESLNITTETGTQIQTKLGQNIDVILTSQFLSNLMEHDDYDVALRERIRKGNEMCVNKIQRAIGHDGSITGSGWAGVLQSSFAANALESAQLAEIVVDESRLEKTKAFQKNNYNAQTGDVKTEMGAGVMLYSVSGSSRASAKEARRVKEEMEAAKKKGTLPENAPASAENLQKIGFDKDDAMRYATAFGVYESAKLKAQDKNVMDGFGSNGGEEFLSYLQTGEGMVIGKDNTWTTWYDNISGRLLKIQNNDGSWNGHHCITSPVFCTATCLLILSVNNDVDQLIKLGATR